MFYLTNEQSDFQKLANYVGYEKAVELFEQYGSKAYDLIPKDNVSDLDIVDPWHPMQNKWLWIIALGGVGLILFLRFVVFRPRRT
jgi:hypothetical protein